MLLFSNRGCSLTDKDDSILSIKFKIYVLYVVYFLKINLNFHFINSKKYDDAFINFLRNYLKLTVAALPFFCESDFFARLINFQRFVSFFLTSISFLTAENSSDHNVIYFRVKSNLQYDKHILV